MAVVYRTVARRRRAIVVPPKAVLRPARVVVAAPDYSGLKKAELVAAAEAAGVDASGTKAEIAARLSDG